MTRTHTPTEARSSNRRWWWSEGGSILIPVAVCMLGLLTFSAFTIDHGVLLSSRRQAQTAADAGALAAALYLAFDDGTDQPGAQAAAVEAAQLNMVWGSPPDVTLADVTFPTCPAGAPGPVDDCVRVDVFRNQRSNGSPLPAFFATLAGVTQQGVRATATAQVLYSDTVNTANCLLPFAIPDRFEEHRESWQVDPPAGDPWGDAVDDSNGSVQYPDDSYDVNFDQDRWDPDDEYDVVTQQGNHGGVPLNGIVDRYMEGPYSSLNAPGTGPTGFSIERDRGMRVLLKANNGSRIAPSFYYPVTLPDTLGGRGANRYRQRIRGCHDLTTDIGPGYPITVEPGNMVGPTTTIQELIDADPSPTHWQEGSTPADGGIVTFHPSGVSPRHRAVLTFDPHNFMTGHRTGRGEIVMTGVVGVFIESFSSGEIWARITEAPPMDASASTLTTNTSSFLRTVVLVR